MLEAVIFDMDGVLIDSEPLHFLVEQQAFAKLGLPATKEELDLYVGMTNPDMWAKVKERHGVELPLSELIEWQVEMKLSALKKSEEQAIDGVTGLLEQLKAGRIAVGLASSSPKVFIMAVLEKLGISEYFDCVVSGEEVPKGKPEPDVFLKAAELLNKPPHSCVVIEDSRNGTRAAKSAGMKCIGFQNVNSGEQDLSAADKIVHSMREITLPVLEAL
ncbi:HAD family hydrolase [Paenibacillus sp. NPDC056579]|uniref:HAD family hydrolase n=1 Tax=Paenibacillus sp. NPDC056579 TaxID=3345871 RepID=UPI0036BD537E